VSRSVLVVDDDPVFRGLARRLLAAVGMTVIGEADSVAAALAAAVEIEPAAILVDVELPDGNWVELAGRLIALPGRPSVVLTSIDADAVSDDDLRRSGARAFVHKADLPSAPLAELLGPP
jgi:DNA-binding NarL/FixJ family response regulator